MRVFIGSRLRLGLALAAAPACAWAAFSHPGALHTAADFRRMAAKVDAGAEPWKSGWDKLVANSHASPSYRPQGPVPIVYRGTGSPENYGRLYNDIAAAYQNALRWKIAGDAACARKAVEILDAWSGTLTAIDGTADRFLAAGLYGYEFAQAAELMRDYSGWAAADFVRCQQMMLSVFYPLNHSFLVNHNGACISHYWCNWDACNLCSMIAIAILCDDQAKFDEAVGYFKNGAGNGSLEHAVPFVHPGNLGQGQEAGRDQGHATLNISLLGAFCQMAWNQGEDLFAYRGNRLLALCEYTAKYNLGQDVPYSAYNNCDNVNQTAISAASRGTIRPCWELVYQHYANVKGLAAPWSAQFAALVRPEGGGGDYGPNSGGFDQLGFGTLTATLDPLAPVVTAQPASQTVAPGGGVSLGVAAAGAETLSYQWARNGAALPGATARTLALANLATDAAGDYAVTVTNAYGAATSRAARLTVATPVPGRLANLSVRAALADGQALIVGLTMSGGARDVLVRAAGPALATFGLAGTMADPRLDVFRGATRAQSNDDWDAALRPAFASVGAFDFPPGSRDAALVLALDGGSTIQARGTAGGLVLVEAYDLGAGASPRLVNLSARQFVGPGDDVLLAGFTLGGNVPKKLLVRGVGPTLARFGVATPLADPRLEIFDARGALVAAAGNWLDDPQPATLTAAAQAVGAFPLASGSKDAALLLTLPAGGYTAAVSGAGGLTGEALVELYEVP